MEIELLAPAVGGEVVEQDPADELAVALIDRPGRRRTSKAISGVELVGAVARVATMNLLLHGIGDNASDELPIVCQDFLKEPPKTQFEAAMTSPPFGIKGYITYAQDHKTHAHKPSRGEEALKARKY